MRLVFYAKLRRSDVVSFAFTMLFFDKIKERTNLLSRTALVFFARGHHFYGVGVKRWGRVSSGGKGLVDRQAAMGGKRWEGINRGGGWGGEVSVERCKEDG